MSEKKGILIVDDHALLRSGLRLLLSADSMIEVLGEAGNSVEAIRLAGELSPDLVLTDLAMPGMNGIEAIAQIKARHPKIRVLVLSMHRGEDHLHRALRAGADGYILKDESSEELLLAIHKVAGGAPHFSAELAGSMLGDCLEPVLTLREREVLRLIARGHPNKQIASCLFLSVKTVEKHRANVMKKLDLHNASRLTAYAIEKGIYG